MKAAKPVRQIAENVRAEGCQTAETKLVKKLKPAEIAPVIVEHVRFLLFLSAKMECVI